MFEDKVILITGGTGSFGQKFVPMTLEKYNPKKIIIVSSAPQIRYPDCYGIDMANLESLIAFNAALSLLRENGSDSLIKEVYSACKKELELADDEMKNHVKKIYDHFSADQISNKITELLSSHLKNREVKIIFQSIENLHKACPDSKGDWYFTGNYPTPGGNRVVNTAFVNFYEGNKKRAY